MAKMAYLSVSHPAHRPLRYIRLHSPLHPNSGHVPLSCRVLERTMELPWCQQWVGLSHLQDRGYSTLHSQNNALKKKEEKLEYEKRSNNILHFTFCFPRTQKYRNRERRICRVTLTKTRCWFVTGATKGRPLRGGKNGGINARQNVFLTPSLSEHRMLYSFIAFLNGAHRTLRIIDCFELHSTSPTQKPLLKRCKSR